MKILGKKIFLLLVPLFLVSVISLNFIFPAGNFKLLETSILTILQNIAEQNATEPPDISIESVVLRKADDPTENFNYYRYTTTIILKNHGGDLFDARVILRGGDDQKTALVRNTDDGFTLLGGESYIVRNYEVIFDGRYNGGKVDLELDVVDEEDYYLDNNYYSVDIFESPAKIKDISLEEIASDGTFSIDFNAIPFSIKKHDFYVFTGDDAVYDKSDLRYDEVYTSDQIYGYHRIKNSFENVDDVEGNFSKHATTEEDAHSVKFSDDPFEDESNHYFYVKAVNPENGYYAVSNILSFSSDDSLTRAAFAKSFVDLADIEVVDNGGVYFEDVPEEDWYAPSVETLFNLGLLETESFEFLPDEMISRAEALRIVMEYFDFDLTLGEGLDEFLDMDQEYSIYPYLDAFVSSGMASAFHEYFDPDAPATKKYLIYLVNEFSESN